MKKTKKEASAVKNCEPADLANLNPSTHRRILNFLNVAVHPEDLMFKKAIHFQAEGDHIRVDNPEMFIHRNKQILSHELAHEIFEFREREFPLGFKNISELLAIDRFRLMEWEVLISLFGESLFGSWSVFPQDIPKRGPDTGNYGVIHAALLHTGQVLFITADQTTLLWNPEDATASSFENPLNQPHTMLPDGYSQLCGHHVFLSDGKLLSIGGGGYGHNHLARWGYKFDPVRKSWSRTTGPMSESKWYPTAVALGDKRVLVTCGHGTGEMDIYDETTDAFSKVDLTEKPFPSLYPGLHLLPNHSIFYSRTGWGAAGPNQGGPLLFKSDDQSSFFILTGHNNQGVWYDIAPAPQGIVDRTQGMSILLLSNTSPHVRILVFGGADPATNNTYEIIDASILTPATNWSPPMTFPDGEHRSLASGVILPDGNVFVCGGIQRTNSPCTMFNPQTNGWEPMAAMPSVRDYHSVALLLPSGKVMVAGWYNSKIEIYSPPYLFRGSRPVISYAPCSVRYGQTFDIETPDAGNIIKVVLVRPMAVTHQTDTEQKRIEISFLYDHTQPNRLSISAPPGGIPQSFAQQGYYMLFILNRTGVPSIAKWICLNAGEFSPVHAEGDDMLADEVLKPNQSISSANGRYRFIYQGDGNLVLYDGDTPLWASGTDGRPVGVCIMQGDGNLVIYGCCGQYVWDTATDGNPGSRLVVQDDGNVVIYRPDGTPVWATNTWLPLGPDAQGDDMQPGEVLNSDQSISSANGRYRFIYQGDGNLVLYDGDTPLWASGTDGRPVGVCIMQGDGNLVIYARGGQYVWDTATDGNPGSRLVVQDDGNVVIYRPDGTAVWATNTGLPLGAAAQGDDMQPGEVLNSDQSITSANGRYRFIYQGDGNLVLYDGNTPLWASGTDGRPVGVCIMQGDGNLVIYARGGQYVWDTATDGNPGSRLVVQDDGNVVIYRPDGTAVWATNTGLPLGAAAQGDDMQPGEVLNSDQSITSANGRYRFIYQGDGNLVLYDGNTPLWASGTDGRPVGVCIMQGDGNLVIYAHGGQYVWDTATDGNPGSRLVVQDDGNVVIYRADGTPVWATNTVQP